MSTPAATRLQILQAVEDGQISAHEADRLLATVDGTSGPAEVMVRVQAVETATGRLRVDLVLPLAAWRGMADLELRPDAFWGLAGSIDLAEVLSAVDQGARGLLAESVDEGQGLHVTLSVDEA